MNWEQPEEIDYFYIYICNKRLIKKMKALNNNQQSDAEDIEFEDWNEDLMFSERFYCKNFPEFRKQLIKKYPLLKRANFDNRTLVFADYEIFFWGTSVGAVHIFRKYLGFKDLYQYYSERGEVQQGLDELPQHEPDGYWSGSCNYKPIVNDKSVYAEGVKDICDLQVACNKHGYPYSLETKSNVRFRFNDSEDWRCYVENVYLKNLINDQGDNYIRWLPLNAIKKYADQDKLEGLFQVRCGDCGKVAQGFYKGSPDMGDRQYAIYHRKNYFCEQFGWTYMGGHGYPGGRRMICPECSQEYASGKRKIQKNDKE